MATLISGRVLLSTLWLFILPFALVVKPDAKPDARQHLQTIYSSQVGVREATGVNDGPEVEAYLATTNLGAGYAWCGSFVSWVFEQAGYAQPNTPWTPALFPNRCTIWPHKGKTPQQSDVFGLYITHLKRIGHAGFVEEWGDSFVVTVEGNTNPAGNYDGDGVYRRRRRTKTIYRVADWVACNNNQKCEY